MKSTLTFFSLLLACSLPFQFVGAEELPTYTLSIARDSSGGILSLASASEPSAQLKDVATQAFALNRTGDPAGARKILETALASAKGVDEAFLTQKMGYLLSRQQETTEAIDYFNRVARKKVAADDAMAAEAQARIGYLHYRDKHYSQAVAAFFKLASGEMPCDTLTSTDAAMRMGFILKLAKNGDIATEVFQQISDQSPMKDEADYALLQVAGLQWESGKGDYSSHIPLDRRIGYFQDSIDTCQLLIKDTAVRDEIRSIAELIYLEDFYFLGDYQKCAELTVAYIAKWSPKTNPPGTEPFKGATFTIKNWPRRQLFTAHAWLVICNYKIGDYEGCISSADEVLSDNWQEDDPYPNFNVRGYSRIYKAFALRQLGEAEQAKALLDEVASKDTKWYNAVYPALLSENAYAEKNRLQN